MKLTQADKALLLDMGHPESDLGQIEEATRSCVRRKTVTVATAPNGTTMGVREPFDDTIMDLPYVSSLSGAAVGDTVTIEWVYGLSNAVVIS